MMRHLYCLRGVRQFLTHSDTMTFLSAIDDL